MCDGRFTEEKAANECAKTHVNLKKCSLDPLYGVTNYHPSKEWPLTITLRSGDKYQTYQVKVV